MQQPAVSVIQEPSPEPSSPEPQIRQEIDEDNGDDPEEGDAPEESSEERVPGAEPETNDVDALFEALRGGGHVPEPSSTTDTEEVSSSGGEEETVVSEGEERTSRDWIEVRDSRLLPITNRALRGAKKALTELQNIALDSLRTDEDWRPDVDAIAEALQAELKAVWAESFAAGHAVAEEMIGSKIKRPPTPAADTLPRFAEGLADSVASVLDGVDNGQRARQSAASRVFRAWRTDEAERRIRELALHAYEMGVERSVEVDTSVG